LENDVNFVGLWCPVKEFVEWEARM